MAHIAGISSPVYINTGATPTPPAAGTTATGPTANNVGVIDGTPVRVVILCLAAAAGLMALRAGGLKFSIGASV